MIPLILFFFLISYSVLAQQFQVSNNGKVKRITPAVNEVIEDVDPHNLLERHNRLNVEIESRENALRDLMSERDKLNSVLENPNVQRVLNSTDNSEQFNGEVESP